MEAAVLVSSSITRPGKLPYLVEVHNSSSTDFIALRSMAAKGRSRAME